MPPFGTALAPKFFAALACMLLAVPAAAQSSKKNICTVCGEDPKVMEAAGIVNHGPFTFFQSDSAELQKHLDARDMVWLETTHFRFGSDLHPWKIPVSDKKAYLAELEELAAFFPAVDPPKVKTLDRWMRVHLMAFRMEKAYAHLQELFGYTEEQFAVLPAEEIFVSASDSTWQADLAADFLSRPKRAAGMPGWVGLGRYLGMPMKFEVLMLHYEADLLETKQHYIGHIDAHPQRWHNTWRPPNTEPASRSMWFGFSTEADKMKHDQHVHNALLHNVTINILDGFMLYLVEAPVWLRSGFGHYMSRRNSMKYNFYDLDEGSSEQSRDAEEWKPLVRKYVTKDEAPGFSELSRMRSFGDLNFVAHLTSWSKLMFLMEHDPTAFGKWIVQLKTDPNQTNNLDAQRVAFKDNFGWTFIEADEKWAAWVLETYAVK